MIRFSALHCSKKRALSNKGPHSTKRHSNKNPYSRATRILSMGSPNRMSKIPHQNAFIYWHRRTGIFPPGEGGGAVAFLHEKNT